LSFCKFFSEKAEIICFLQKKVFYLQLNYHFFNKNHPIYLLMRQKKHINWRGAFLALLLLGAFAARDMHFLLAHQEQDRKVCDAKGGEKHIHGEDYSPHPCNLCDFSFSIFDLPFFLKLKQRVLVKISNRCFNDTTRFFNGHRNHYFLRGPPSLDDLV
jgi:hypothetical protein